MAGVTSLLRRLAPVLAVAALLSALPGVTAAPPAVAAPRLVAGSPQSDLGARVSQALAGSTATVLGGYVVVDGLGLVYADNPASTLRPASNEKLYTGYTAYTRLGPTRRYVTSVAAVHAPDAAGVVHGDIVFRAAGDPTLSAEGLTDLVDRLRRNGVRRVTGRLVVDVTRYDTRRDAPGWKPEFVGTEVGPLSAFALDRNEYRNDTGFVRDPVPANAARLRNAITGGGIPIDGGTAFGRYAVATVDLARHSSERLSDILHVMLKDSVNFYAEMMLKELGAEAGGGGTTARGAQVVVRTVTVLGVAMTTYLDGSGLSYDDRITARRAEVFLEKADTMWGTTFRSALAIACVDGTLAKRMCGTAAAGRVWAKTGTLTGVSNLSGYTVTHSGRGVWFSFLMHGVSSTASARAAQDRAVVALASYDG
jgi:D-alanyl-D-alanine carboxypeptidase